MAKKMAIAAVAIVSLAGGLYALYRYYYPLHIASCSCLSGGCVWGCLHAIGRIALISYPRQPAAGS